MQSQRSRQRYNRQTATNAGGKAHEDAEPRRAYVYEEEDTCMSYEEEDTCAGGKAHEDTEPRRAYVYV
jgi:hypothetical protein